MPLLSRAILKRPVVIVRLTVFVGVYTTFVLSIHKSICPLCFGYLIGEVGQGGVEVEGIGGI